MLCLETRPDGSLAHKMPADPQCNGGISLVEASDIPPNPFYLSMEEGGLIASAVAGVWLLAWSFKAIRSVLKDNDNE